MTASLSHRYAFFVLCCVIFVYAALIVTGVGTGTNMFTDTDPLWHVAIGDWIREHHAIPRTDPWSFTAGDYRWLDISWAWDTGMSIVHEHFGWHGAIAVNALTIALLITVLYATSCLRSGDTLASFISLFGGLSLTAVTLRPLQITFLMTAVWMLILGNVARRQCSVRWLGWLPPLMLIWVNCHGGFITGCILLLAFFLQAVLQRDTLLMKPLFITGVVTFFALFCNPYGIYIIEAAWRPMTTVANKFIHEWQYFTTSPKDLLQHTFALACILLLIRRPVPNVLPVERWLAYFWFFSFLTAVRHIYVFAAIATPIFACILHEFLPAKRPAILGKLREALLHIYDRKPLAIAALALSIGFILWLPGPRAAQMYQQENVPIKNLNAEIAFLDTHYPHIRLLNHFDLGGYFVYETRGRIPVFVDSRTETAYPVEVFKDYMRFAEAKPGWEEVLERYKIGGVILPNKDYDEMMDRFLHREGWKMVFKGPLATIFIRQ